MNTPTCITSLPREILLKILTALPLKSVVRFRCTSKFFYSFIPEPHFAFRILVSFPSTTRPTNLYTMSYTKESQGKLQANSVPCSYEVQRFKGFVGSSFADGKICLFNHFGEVTLCDLSTTQHISLPRIPPAYSTCAALGFDSVSKRYKILKSEFYYNNNPDSMLKVLTLGVDESWREVTMNSFIPGHSIASVQIDDGIIYLINCKTKPDIVAFDVGTENLSMIPTTIPFPYEYQPCFPPSRFSSPWVKLNGRLAFIYILVENLRSKIDVWTLEKSMEWEKHEVPLPLEENKIISQADSMSFTTNSIGEIVFLIRGAMGMSPLILLYAFGRQVWRKFEICGLHDYVPLSDNLRSLVHVEESVYFPE